MVDFELGPSYLGLFVGGHAANITMEVTQAQHLSIIQTLSPSSTLTPNKVWKIYVHLSQTTE